MRYFNHFFHSSGFQNGELVPPGVKVYCWAYAAAVNHMSKALNSAVRLLPVQYKDRSCPSLVMVNVDRAGGDEAVDAIVNGDSWLQKVPEGAFDMPDQAMLRAIEAAKRIDVDGTINYVFTVMPGFDAWLAERTQEVLSERT